MTDRDACIGLNLINGIGPMRMAALLQFAGSHAAIFELDEDTLVRVPGISKNLAKAIGAPSLRGAIDAELEKAEKCDATILTVTDSDYPELLKSIHDPPICLYVRGRFPENLASRALALVGTRNPSRYGVSMARHLSESAVYADWTTVSGLAIGVDTVVHRATLDAGGTTVAVLGGGLLKFHPQENLPLARAIVEQGGAVISEFPLSLSPSRHTFPMRNRIISGLSHGTLVVEAGTNSGSLITAAHAVEQGRRVFAVPGEANHANANGCNALIRQGAVLVENFEHVLQEFDFLPGFEHGAGLSFRETASGDETDLFASNTADTDSDLAFADLKTRLLAILRKQDATIDELCTELSVPASDIMASLIALEIMHKVQKLHTGAYRKLR